MKIVHLDAFTTIMDGIELSALEDLGNFKAYNNTSSSKIVERSKDADIIITNKVTIDKNIIDQLPNLKYICVAATGYNVVDVKYAASKNIPVSNVSGYSTNSVVQTVFGHILNVIINISYYDSEVMDGRWQKTGLFTFYDHSIRELAGKTIGIYGFGTIGKKVAQVALAFDMNVIAHSRNPERDAMEGVDFVSFEDLCRDADYITLHASMNEQNKGIIDKYALLNMKETAILINTGRGGLIVEHDLAQALENDIINYACLDVLSEEPPSDSNPLLHCKNCVITPHIGWASLEARQRLIAGVADNISSFKNGSEIKNKVN